MRSRCSNARGAVLALALVLAAVACARGTPVAKPSAAPPKPPVARRVPTILEAHGHKRVDEYAWLKQRDAPEVLAHLKAENDYSSAMLAHLDPLREVLYAETVARIEETDKSPEVKNGAFVYYSRTYQGKAYRVYCRRSLAAHAREEVLLDLNELARGKPFLALGAFELSDDGRWLAYSLDTEGDRDYTLRFRDLRSGRELPEAIEKVSSVAFDKSGRGVFYARDDDAKRPFEARYHALGTDPSQDLLVLREPDERFNLDVWRSRSKELVLFGSFSHTTSEVFVLAADAAPGSPGFAPRSVAGRVEGREYMVDHRGSQLYLRINDTGRNFRIAQTPLADPGAHTLTEVVAHDDRVMLEWLAVFDDFFALGEREAGLPQLRITRFDTRESSRVALPDASYELWEGENPEHAASSFRFEYESLTTPESHYDYELASGKLTLVKRTTVRGFQPSRYRVERLSAQAEDGTEVPISLVRRVDLAKAPGPEPMLLVGYGAYGFPYPAAFSYSRVGLLDRGVTYAIAHVRGGGELGKAWHDQGRMQNKPQSFADFIAVAEKLIALGYTSRERLVVSGGSAGGLLISAVLNQKPELFRAAVLEVPFVDVLSTMSDPSLPLTVGEYEEWGNPSVPEEYTRIASYCPYTNLGPRRYPQMLVRTSYHDSQVGYWEPAKYVAKLRALGTARGPVLLRIEMDAGHGGASGRYDAIREAVFDHAYVLDVLGLASTGS